MSQAPSRGHLCERRLAPMLGGPFVLRRQSVAAPPEGNRCISSASEQSMPVTSRVRCEGGRRATKSKRGRRERKSRPKSPENNSKSTPAPRTRAAILSVIIFAISPLVMVKGYGPAGEGKLGLRKITPSSSKFGVALASAIPSVCERVPIALILSKTARGFGPALTPLGQISRPPL